MEFELTAVDNTTISDKDKDSTDHQYVCMPASAIIGKKITNCEDDCPFPFCVVEELGKTQLMLIDKVRKLENSIIGLCGFSYSHANVNANTRRTTKRYMFNSSCNWCKLTSVGTILCRSKSYCVVNIGIRNKFAVILNKHRKASKQEESIVRYFIEYAFGSGVGIMRGDTPHDYWVVDSVRIEQESKFSTMCSNLNSYLSRIDRISVQEVIQQSKIRRIGS